MVGVMVNFKNYLTWAIDIINSNERRKKSKIMAFVVLFRCQKIMLLQGPFQRHYARPRMGGRSGRLRSIPLPPPPYPGFLLHFL